MRIFKILIATSLLGSLPLFAGGEDNFEPLFKKRKIGRHIGLAEIQEAIENAILIVENQQPLEIPQPVAINYWTLEEQANIQEALVGVDGLAGDSFELSFSMYNDADLERTLNA